jgi:leader peptidase (prepilin peptidase)/N-methyltransferase
MSLAAAGIAFVPALAVGSFLNVVAARVPLKRSIVSPPSACMSCGTELSWRDNVPVLSWLLLRGRCRTCDVSISWRYPAVELATALLAAVSFWKFGLSWEAGIAAFYCATLVVLSSIDVERRIVPNVLVLPAAVIVLVAQTIVHPSVEWFAGGAGASLFLLLAALAYPRGMGMGDVKLALLLGFMVGRYVPIALFLGMVSALIPSLVLFARHGKAARKMAIPFAPFLAIGGLIALFAGHWIAHAYLSTF